MSVSCTRSRATAAGALFLTLAGCATPPPTPLDRPSDVPAAFTEPQGNAKTAWPQADWWTGFRLPELTALMEKSQAGNLDIAQAAARVREAEANSRIAYANMLPQVSADFAPTRRGSKYLTSNNFGATLSGSYLLDYLGQNRDAYQSARESLRAARYDAAAVGLATQSAVAEAYFNILAYREQITVTRRDVEAARRLLVISQAKFDAGATSKRDVSQEQVAVSAEEGRLPVLLAEELQARYTLAVLLGRPPEAFDIKGQNLDDVSTPAIRGGLPSELLTRRPDIAESEALLLAAHANVDAARTAYFPHISLTASGGWSSATFQALTDPSSFLWSVGASVTQTIFDGGGIAAQNARARAQQDELVASYRQTVFQAFQDVEASLDSVYSGNQQLAIATTEAVAASEAFRVSELQYREGTIDISALLSAQQQLFSAQDSLVTAKLARLLGNVQLYIALGGGWRQDDSDAQSKPAFDWEPL